MPLDNIRRVQSGTGVVFTDSRRASMPPKIVRILPNQQMQFAVHSMVEGAVIGVGNAASALSGRIVPDPLQSALAASMAKLEASFHGTIDLAEERLLSSRRNNTRSVPGTPLSSPRANTPIEDKTPVLVMTRPRSSPGALKSTPKAKTPGV